MKKHVVHYECAIWSCEHPLRQEGSSCFLRICSPVKASGEHHVHDNDGLISRQVLYRVACVNISGGVIVDSAGEARDYGWSSCVPL